MNRAFTQRQSFIVLCLCCITLILFIRKVELFAETQKPQAPFTFRIILAEKKCQMAIWLVDLNGGFVDTIYVTKKTAKKGLGNRGGKLDGKLGGSRLSILPVWAHQRGIDYGGGNFYPTKKRPLADAISSATPKSGEFVWSWNPKEPLKTGKYYYYIEVNKSFDDNEHHDYSWYRGQPSVIWKGPIIIGDERSKGKAKIIGSGHPAGSDGHINSDLSSLTTAINLIAKAEVNYNP